MRTALPKTSLRVPRASRSIGPVAPPRRGPENETEGSCMHLKTSEQRHEKRGARLYAALAVAAVLACSTAAHAQDEAKQKAGLSVWRSSGCSECHGAFANGEKKRDEAPTGANLRQT